MRSRARLDYEIKTLQKSIRKDQKQVAKEMATLSFPAEASEEVISESLELSDGEDYREALNTSQDILYHSLEELQEILNLLLHFGEDSKL